MLGLCQRGQRGNAHKYIIAPACMATVAILLALSPASHGQTVVTSEKAGVSRLSPASPGSEIVSNNLAISVIEVLSGEEAYDRLIEANQLNPAPPPGEEYVLVQVLLRHVGNNGMVEIHADHFGLTGSRHVLYSIASVVGPVPKVSGALYPGDQVRGWLPMRAATGETHRQLVYAPTWTDEFETWRFVALAEPEPVPAVDPATVPLPNDIGADPSSPAPSGEYAITQYFAVQVLESVSGDEAKDILLELNPYRSPVSEEHTEVLVKLSVQSRINEDFPVPITWLDFTVMGDDGVEIPSAVAITPQPDLYGRLYPGGTIEGWLSFQVPRNLNSQTIQFLWHLDPNAERRYLSIE